jgi:hypothetical protein
MKLVDDPMNLFLPIVIFFAPISGIFLTVAVFVSLDTAVGVWKAYKLKQPITSRRLSDIVSKLILYEALILATFLINKHITAGAVDAIFNIEFFITKFISVILIYIEFKSINENYEEVTGVSIWKSLRELVARGKEIKKDIDEE